MLNPYLNFFISGTKNKNERVTKNTTIQFKYRPRTYLHIHSVNSRWSFLCKYLKSRIVFIFIDKSAVSSVCAILSTSLNTIIKRLMMIKKRTQKLSSRELMDLSVYIRPIQYKAQIFSPTHKRKGLTKNFNNTRAKKKQN